MKATYSFCDIFHIFKDTFGNWLGRDEEFGILCAHENGAYIVYLNVEILMQQRQISSITNIQV